VGGGSQAQARGGAAAGGQACCRALSRARRALRGPQRQLREGASLPPGHRRRRGASGSAGASRGRTTGAWDARRARRGGRAAQRACGGGAAHWALRMSISVLQLWCSQCLPTCFSASARASSSCARAQPMCDTAPDTSNDGPCRSAARAPAARVVRVAGPGPGLRLSGRQAAALLAGAEPRPCQLHWAALPRLCGATPGGVRHPSEHS
jgi:hypothetical protein